MKYNRSMIQSNFGVRSPEVHKM